MKNHLTFSANLQVNFDKVNINYFYTNTMNLKKLYQWKKCLYMAGLKILIKN